MKNRQNLLEKLDNAREGIVRNLPKAERYKDKEIFPNWTLKEMLAHMTGWDDAVIASLRAHVMGDTPGTPADRGIDDYNEKSVFARKKLTYAHVRKEWENKRETLKMIILEMPTDKFTQALLLPWGETGTTTYTLEVFIHHENHHAQQLDAWLENPDHSLPESVK